MTSRSDEVLAAGPIPVPKMSLEMADRIANLALLISQRATVVITPHQARPWHERSEKERIAMRSGVVRVIQALILLGYMKDVAE